MSRSRSVQTLWKSPDRRWEGNAQLLSISGVIVSPSHIFLHLEFLPSLLPIGKLGEDGPSSSGLREILSLNRESVA